MSKSISKYAPLEAYLRGCTTSECKLSFSEIEELLGFGLPESAKTHRAWWSNNPNNNVMTRAWLAAGWETERVDMEAKTLVFVRRGKPAAKAEVPAQAPSQPPRGAINVFGALKGTIRITGDILAPIDVEWNAQEGRL